MLLNERVTAPLARVASKTIYGTVILFALIGSVADPLPASRRVIVTVFLSMLAVSVAHAFAQRIHEEMASRRIIPLREHWRALLQSGWVMASGVVPIVLFTFSALGWIGQETALMATKRGLFLLLVVFGFVARRMSGGGIPVALLSGTILGLLGYGVGQIKLWTKYLPEL